MATSDTDTLKQQRAEAVAALKAVELEEAKSDVQAWKDLVSELKSDEVQNFIGHVERLGKTMLHPDRQLITSQMVQFLRSNTTNIEFHLKELEAQLEAATAAEGQK